MTVSDPVDGLRAGMRAVVRHRIDHGVTDALGDVVAIDPETISVRTRLGVVTVERVAVVAAKEVPPKPTRRGASHLAISMEGLERIMADGWPPVERAELGGWLLRAAGGFTGRANSVLPLGNPGVPLSEAVERCESWYDERGLRHLFCLFGPAGFRAADDPLGVILLGRDYEQFNRALVLTAATAILPSETAPTSGARILLESAPSQRWWDAWSAGDARVAPADEADVAPSVARTVMTSSPDQLFASLEVEGAVIGVARVAFAQAWAGVFALRVEPEHRRRGIAIQLMGALADASRARGIRSMYLQVTEDNPAARGLYGRLGFSVHHEYFYLGR
ncbi:MAG: GNAT family N-acetyltransferase [Actinomycetota bacterium]